MYHLIANPSSRSGYHAQSCDRLQSLLRQDALPYRLYRSKGPGDARKLAAAISSRLLPEADTVFSPPDPEEIRGKTAENGHEPLVLVILGGDGTINEVINGVRSFDSVRIGIVPAGSSNDFARGLELPSDPEAALRRVVKGKVRRTIDLGRVTLHRTTDVRSRLYDRLPDEGSEGSPASLQRLFCVSAGIGYDAAICEEALASPVKNFFNALHLGKATYGFIGIRQMFTSPRVRADVQFDDGSTFHTDRMLFSAAMNEPFEGGGYRFAPDADDTDGMLNMIIIGDISIPRALLSFPAAHAGRYYSVRGVNHFFAKSMRIRTSEPLWVHTDGEVTMQSDDVTLECLPGRLPLIV